MNILDVKDEMTSHGIIATQLNPYGWAESGRGAYDCGDNWFVRSPMFKKGEAIEFVTDSMEVGKPYPFQFLGWWFLAVKRTNGSLDFLHIEGE